MRRSFARGEGCRECFDTGFQGRTGIYEVLPSTPELRRMITQEASQQEVRDWFRKEGYTTLLDCGLELAEREESSLEEIAHIALAD